MDASKLNSNIRVQQTSVTPRWWGLVEETLESAQNYRLLSQCADRRFRDEGSMRRHEKHRQQRIRFKRQYPNCLPFFWEPENCISIPCFGDTFGLPKRSAFFQGIESQNIRLSISIISQVIRSVTWTSSSFSLVVILLLLIVVQWSTFLCVLLYIPDNVQFYFYLHPPSSIIPFIPGGTLVIQCAKINC